MTFLFSLPTKLQLDYKQPYKYPFNPFKSYFYSGKAGIGKTFLALHQIKECLRRCPVKYEIIQNQPNQDPEFLAPEYETNHYCFAKSVEMLEVARQQMSQSQEEKQDAKTQLKYWKNIDCLVIDDFGAELVTPYQQEIIYNLLDYRLNYRDYDGGKLITIFTSNYDIDQLSKTYSERITSRILGMCETIEPKNQIDLRIKHN